MRDRFKRVLRLSAALALVFLVGAMALSRRYSPPSLTLAGSEGGLPYRAAAFYVTNSAFGVMALQNVQVQVREGASWKTISDKPIDVIPVIDGGSLHVGWPSLLPSGGHRKIVVEWPEQHTWRVCITYGPEAKGVNGIIEKTKLAWKNRSIAELRTRVWVGSNTLCSEAISD